MPNIHLDNGVPWNPKGSTVTVPQAAPSLGSSMPGGSNITGTTSGQHNPHTDTGFSGGSTLPTGAPNPGYSPPPPGGDGNGGNGGGSGLPGGGDTGGGDTGGGTDTGSGGSGSKPPGMYTPHLVDLFNEITGGNVLEGGIGNLRELSRDTLSGSDLQTMKNLENLDTNTWNIGDTNKGFNWSSENPGTVNWNLNPSNKFTADVNPLGQSYLGFESSFADGGPVGVMSLPQGYAAGGGVDPSDWRILEQILAAGGNPEDYGYENGGPVSEEESYIEDDLESLQQPQTPPLQQPQEEYKPFGGTRENVLDQVEAFDNAPQHIEEPMIGMYGEKVPLSIARRVQKYMEGLDPVKKGLIEETMQMFQMKKMLERQQDMQGSGSYFGPQPNEYNI